MSRLTLKQERSKATPVLAAELPIARVLVNTGVAHLDAPYDYSVPEKLSHAAQPGVRVRVRFAGRLVDGWLLQRVEKSDFAGKLQSLTSVVSSEALLTEELQKTLAEVAKRFAGNLWDVVRTAIPPRHAKVEAQPSDVSERLWQRRDWSAFGQMASFFEHLESGPRAVAIFSPGKDPFTTLADLISEVAARGEGVLVVVPDERDLNSLEEALGDLAGVTTLRANLSPGERYRRYLRIRRGVDHVCIGTRAAIFAPVKDLALIVVWDDGDESHYEQHAPGWNTRDVAAIRSHQEKVALLLTGFSVSVDSARLLEMSWAKLVEPDDLKGSVPRVICADEEPARVTTRTWKIIKEASAKGPVLISVARLGYLPGLQCRRCKSPAVCQCGGPISQKQDSSPQCQMCGALHEKYTCTACGSVGVRAVGIGIERTVEEIGRAFPQRIIRHSTAERPIAKVPNKPMIVVSTQGVEPRTPSGYQAVVILDAYSSLSRPDLRAEEEARRRWFNTAALATSGGQVVIAADATIPAVQSLVRWSPAGAAEREFSQRTELHLPPAWELAVIDIETGDEELKDQLTAIGEVLGPTPREEGWRMIVRAPKGVAGPVKDLVQARAARRQPTRVRINPYTL